MLKSNGKIIHNVLIAKSDMWEDQLQLNRLTWYNDFYGVGRLLEIYGLYMCKPVDPLLGDVDTISNKCFLQNLIFYS